RHQWFKLRPFLVGKIESHGSPPPTVNQLLCCKSTAYVSTDPKNMSNLHISPMSDSIEVSEMPDWLLELLASQHKTEDYLVA
ncbi:MAG: hypothetical protein ACKVP5_09970, partial [Aestuariivirga sp.]